MTDEKNEGPTNVGPTPRITDLNEIRKLARQKALENSAKETLKAPSKGRPSRKQLTNVLFEQNEFFVNRVKKLFAENESDVDIGRRIFREVVTYFGVIPMYNEVLMRREDSRKPVTEGFEEVLIENVRYFATAFYDQRDNTLYEMLRDRITLKAYLKRSYYDYPFNPIQEYLQTQSPANVGEQTPFDRLVACLSDVNGTAKTFLWRWLLGCVGLVFDGEQNAMLVMQGPQGIGKSTLARWLSQGLGLEYFQEGYINPFDKDHKLRLAQKFIWAFDEFGESTNPNVQSAFKAFVTEHTINERLPYDRGVTRARRNCSLIATSNDESLFHDTSGSRRYLTISLSHIDHSYADSIHPDDLWGQVYWAYKQGERGILTDEEKALQIETNENFHDVDPIEHFLRDILINDPSSEIEGRELNARVVAYYLNGLQNAREEKRLQMQVAKIMKQRLKYQAKTVRGRRKYCGCRFAEVSPPQGET